MSDGGKLTSFFGKSSAPAYIPCSEPLDMSHQSPPESDQPALSAESQEAFVRLIKGAQPVLLRYVMSLVGNRGDAEDVLQRASVTMWRRFETFDPDSDFIAWATTVAFYEVRNFQRVSGRSRLNARRGWLSITLDSMHCRSASESFPPPVANWSRRFTRVEKTSRRWHSRLGGPRRHFTTDSIPSAARSPNVCSGNWSWPNEQHGKQSLSRAMAQPV